MPGERKIVVPTYITENSKQPVIAYIASSILQKFVLSNPDPQHPSTSDVAQRLSAIMNRGNLSTKVTRAPASHTTNGMAVALMPLLVGLEALDWKFSNLRRNTKVLDLVCSASREAAEIKAEHTKQWMLRLVSRILFVRFIFSLLIFLSGWLMPFDFEVYIQYHFTKVGDQTKFFMENYIANGDAMGKPSQSMKSLMQINLRWQQDRTTKRE